MDQLVFLVDLNEADDAGRLVASMDFTLNHGPFRRGDDPVPDPGEWVLVHYDEDDTLYWAQVEEVLSDRDVRVCVKWETCEPVLNQIEWSAHVPYRDTERVSYNEPVSSRV